MADKRTMTLNLTDAEMAVLDELASRKELTKTAIMRQALRLYQLIEARRDEGDKVVFENPLKKEKAELFVV